MQKLSPHITNFLSILRSYEYSNQLLRCSVGLLGHCSWLLQVLDLKSDYYNEHYKFLNKSIRDQFILSFL